MFVIFLIVLWKISDDINDSYSVRPRSRKTAVPAISFKAGRIDQCSVQRSDHIGKKFRQRPHFSRYDVQSRTFRIEVKKFKKKTARTLICDKIFEFLSYCCKSRTICNF